MAQNREIAIRIQVDANGAIKNVKSLNDELKNAGVSAKLIGEKAKDGFKDVNSSAGLAGSTLIAFSSGLTDIQFGFRAVANNISQMVTLFGLLVQQTGGARSAFKSLFSQLMGPVGIVVALNAVLAGLQFLEAQMQKNKRASKELTDQVTTEATEARLLISAITDENTTREERINLLDQFNKKHGTNIQNLEDEAELARQLEEAYSGVVQRMQEKAILEALKSEISDLIKLQIKYRNEAGKFADAQGQFALTYGLEAAEGLDPEGLVNRVQGQIDTIIEEYSKTFDLAEALKKQRKEQKKEETEDDEDYINAKKKTYSDAQILQILGEQKFNGALEKAFIGRLKLENDYRDLDAQLKQKDREREEMFRQEDIEAQRQALLTKLENSRVILGLISETTQLFYKTGDKQSKRQFEQQKKFNIATTLIDTFLAAQYAFRNAQAVTGATVIGPYIAAAAATAAGLARVNSIRQQQYRSASQNIGSSGRIGATPLGDINRTPSTGFTAIQPNLTQQEELRVYVLDRDINDVRLRNTNINNRAKVK